MITISKTGSISQSGKIKLNGKILKVGVLTDKVMTNVSVKVVSYLDEVIIHDNLQSKKTVFYPRLNVDGAPEFNNLDYHCVCGFVDIIIEGLSEGDSIQDILFYLE